MNLLTELIEIARKEVGTREAHVNNTGARIVEYQGASWLAPGAWPWCAAFTCWVLREWLEREDVRSYLGLDSFSLAEKWRCRDASAFGWEKWALNRQSDPNVKLRPTLFDERQLAKAGDFVIFDFSHIGLVVQDQIHLSDALHTIEGNTNNKGDRDSNSGDGVWDKTRSPSLVRNYIRIIQP